jgi:hypothetical protein
MKIVVKTGGLTINMSCLQRFLIAVLVSFGLFVIGDAAFAAAEGQDRHDAKQKEQSHHEARPKAQNHHDAKQLVAEKLKTDGRHEIHQKGKYHTSVEVRGGKVAGVHVSHETKGEIPVKKYKTHKKMAQAAPPNFVYASFLLSQSQDMGTVYIGYSYVDEDGNEEIYWFPEEMIVDGETGAVEYVPTS